jgi:formamidopyrimidine-DNA glycosylase
MIDSGNAESARNTGATSTGNNVPRGRGAPCKRCPIQHVVRGSASTFYCQHLQSQPERR